MNFYLPKQEAEFVSGKPKDFLKNLVRAAMEVPEPQVDVRELPEPPHVPPLGPPRLRKRKRCPTCGMIS